MTNVRAIAKLDIKGPKLIKGVSYEGVRVIGDPKDYAKKYYHDGIDELIYIDTVASLYNRISLFDLVEKTVKDVFIPLTVGGGVRSINDVDRLLRSGADKVCLNTSLIQCPHVAEKISSVYGQQSLVASIDFKHDHGDFKFFVDNGLIEAQYNIQELISFLNPLPFCEILLQSIDKDGTGTGFDLTLANTFRDLPNNKILVETDAPYLSPVPLRGKPNEPSYIIHTVKFLSDLKKISFEEFSETTSNNFFNLFGKLN